MKGWSLAKKYTQEMADRDILVFLKTNFQHIGKDEHGKRCVITDEGNYVYAMFPNRKMRNKGIPACESYMKPEGDILTWRDKLPKVETSELDALSEDVPATWDEYTDLLTQMVKEGTVCDGVIAIEDATSWQRLGAARKKAYRKMLGDIIDGKEESSEHPLAKAV